jgi:hypothetical protein
VKPASGKRILRACRRLEKDRPEEALELVGELDSIAGESVSLAARGLIFERQGNAAEAERCFGRVFSAGVPLPALLRQCGRYFKRTGSYERAYHCYSILQSFRPGVINEFLDDLPEDERFRYAPLIVVKLRSGPRPKFYALRPVKAALAARLGPEAAALAFAQMAGNKAGDAPRVRVRSLQEYARAEGRRYEELIPSRTVQMPDPPVFGRAAGGGFEARTRTVFASVLEDVVVSSKSNFLLVGGEALLDYQDGELGEVPLDLDVDPIVFAPADGSFTALIEGGALAEEPLEQAFSLVGVNSYNFGHWLIEFLPRVLACRDLPGFGSVPILIDEQMPPQHLDALRLFAGPDHPVVVLSRGKAVRVKRLWACSMPSYVPLSPRAGATSGVDVMSIDGPAFAALLAKLAPALDALSGAPGPSRIFLTRKDSQHRRLVNRPEVEDWFRSQGFEVLDFGELPFPEQLRLARGAELLVGPEGSSLTITLLAGVDTRIGILDHKYSINNEWYALVCRLLGQTLCYVVGEVVEEDPVYRFNASYRVDTGALPAFLDAVASGGATRQP